MEARAYKTKRGATLFVRQTIGGKWMTFSRAKSGVTTVVDTNKALPTCEGFEPAQEALDAYALQRELGAAVHPDAEKEIAPLTTPPLVNCPCEVAMPPSRAFHFNEHGVCEDPEEIPIPFPKATKVTGSVFLAQTPDGDWTSSSAIDCAWGDDGGGNQALPSLDGLRRPDRMNAVDLALGEMFSSLKNRPIRNKAHQKHCDDACAFLDQYEWHDETPPSPETAAPTGQGTDQEEGAVSAPPSTSDSSREAQVREAEHALAKAWDEYFNVKGEQKSASAAFTARIKDIEEKVRNLKSCIFQLQMGKPLPQGLPFEDGTTEAPPETPTEESGERHSHRRPITEAP